LDTLAAVILAAGKSKRLRSKIPKVLHPIAGQPMICYPVEAVAPLGVARLVVVIGPESQGVRQVLGDTVEYAEQSEPLGTGHALRQAQPLLEGQATTILSLYGDHPLTTTDTLRRLVERHVATEATITMLTVEADDSVTTDTRMSLGFGRIIRDATGRVQAIVEEAVATPEQRRIRELNVGIYCFQAAWLWPSLERLPLGPVGEYYLTDLLALAVAEGQRVETVAAASVDEVIGVNNRLHLAQAERVIRERIRREALASGVTLLDPPSTFIDKGVVIGADTVLYPGTIIEGRSHIGSDCAIGPYSHIVNATIGEGCRIVASTLEDAVVEDGVTIGPYAHLRAGTHIGPGGHIGNFAEVKNSRLGRGVHQGHFSYIGDATVGEGVNIGAGTVTCNFDGEKKHLTVIEDGAFIGSDTMLIAPVRVGRRAKTGAGSVVTHDVPPESVVYGVPARVAKKGQED
jgi:bifunctional UDP-N-acetylglucosamine pyrophosphorylase/glucosamine-1-phosphate N-acetyltransferase